MKHFLFTHLCHLFLESERESSASVGKRPRPVGYVLQPLDDEGGCDIEWEISYDVKVWWICGAMHTHSWATSFLYLLHYILYNFNLLTSLPGLRDISWEPSVHSVGEYVPVDNPHQSRCCFRQQLWKWTRHDMKWRGKKKINERVLHHHLSVCRHLTMPYLRRD